MSLPKKWCHKMTQTQVSSSMGPEGRAAAPHAHATPSPCHAFLGGLGPAALPCPVSVQGINFSSSVLWCSGRLTSSEGSRQRGEAPFPRGGRPLSAVGAIFSPNRCCKEQTRIPGSAAGVKPAPARTARCSAAMGRALPASLSPSKSMRGWERRGERGRGATASVRSLAGQGEEAQGVGKGKC